MTTGELLREAGAADDVEIDYNAAFWFLTGWAEVEKESVIEALKYGKECKK